MRDIPLDSIDPGVAAGALRSLAALLQRAADFLDPRCMARRLPLEPVKIVVDADQRIHERRHQLFVRYY
jgi:hypothetical protein